jgi:hypothetical protein
MHPHLLTQPVVYGLVGRQPVSYSAPETEVAPGVVAAMVVSR